MFNKLDKIVVLIIILLKNTKIPIKGRSLGRCVEVYISRLFYY